MMTLEQLRIFVAVAEELHFTRAARRLRLTQPAVSSAIATLEQAHQVPLFHRIGRSVSLTEAGRLLVPQARLILRQVAGAEQQLADLSGLRHGTVRIIASQTAGTYWLPPRLHHFAEHYPGVSITLAIGNSRQVLAAVLAGDVDLGLLESVVDDPHVSRRVCAEDRLVIAVGQGHPWFGRATVPAAELEQAAWIAREDGSGTRAQFEQALRGLGVDLRCLHITLTLPNGEAIRTALLSGHGAAGLSDLVVADDVAAGRLHALPLPVAPRPFTLIRHLERYEAAATRAFVASLPVLSGVDRP